MLYELIKNAGIICWPTASISAEKPIAIACTEHVHCCITGLYTLQLVLFSRD